MINLEVKFMADTRTYALAIYEILKEYSDEEHILSNPKIIELLELKYQINMNQRTVINNIEALIDFGIDISPFSENRKGYYLRDRSFEDSEVALLCNCIHSAHFIPIKDSNDLIKKITDTQSKYKKKKFINTVYINNMRKTVNKQLLYNIGLLMDAIDQKKKITFKYLHNDRNKKLVEKREKLYTISPYYVVQENENLYLLCRNKNYPDLAHYRIDKMKDIQLMEEGIVPLQKSFDPYEYTKNKKFMWTGVEENIYLRCHERMLDDLIDQFGREITIQNDPEHPEYFFTRLHVPRNGIIYFALQYLKYCEVLQPQDIRDEITQILEEKLTVYKK